MKLDTTKVIAYLQKCKSKRFTTMSLANKFKVTKQQAAAGVAILRIKDIVEPDVPAKTKDGVSRWVFTG